MNAWFGTSWGAPINEAIPYIPVPVGEVCLHCDELIAAADSGVRMPHSTSEAGEPVDRAAYLHVECQFRMILGSVGHLLKVCSCYDRSDAAYDDPPGMSTREAAKAALDLHYALCATTPEGE